MYWLNISDLGLLFTKIDIYQLKSQLYKPLLYKKPHYAVYETSWYWTSADFATKVAHQPPTFEILCFGLVDTGILLLKLNRTPLRGAHWRANKHNHHKKTKSGTLFYFYLINALVILPAFEPLSCPLNSSFLWFLLNTQLL